MLSTSTLLYTIYSFKFLAFKNRTKVSFPLPPSLSCDKTDIPQYLCLTGVVYLEHKSWLQISDDNVWWQGVLGWDLTARKSLCGHSSVFQELGWSHHHGLSKLAPILDMFTSMVEEWSV